MERGKESMWRKERKKTAKAKDKDWGNKIRWEEKMEEKNNECGRGKGRKERWTRRRRSKEII